MGNFRPARLPAAIRAYTDANGLPKGWFDFKQGVYFYPFFKPNGLLDFGGVAASGGANGKVTDNGVIVSATAPRIGSGTGLLVEGSSTNLLVRSEDFSASDWSKLNGAVVVSNQATSPDGTQNADELQLAATGDIQLVQGIALDGATAGRTFVQSVYIMGDMGGEELRFNVAEFGGVQTPEGEISSAVTVTSSFQRYDFACTVVQNDRTSLQWRIRGSNLAQTIFVWGAQFEEAASASSYISTEASAVPRTPDSLSFTCADLGWASDQSVDATYADGTTATLTASAGVLTLPASSKAYSLLIVPGD